MKTLSDSQAKKIPKASSEVAEGLALVKARSFAKGLLRLRAQASKLGSSQLLLASFERSWKREQTAAATGTEQNTAVGAVTMTGTVNKQEVPSPVSLLTRASEAPYWLTKSTGRGERQFPGSLARSREARMGE